ncbi:ABC transporter permease [Sporomusa termitida]|uniref:NtrB: nitrate ABC transporter, permease protein n=1 Tax=Sporomusa termitida TaxID=2377 RepID=A0A517DWG8_9FIRM|nr:ABC transporter permease subunit [Sporomusa termitida]QDR81692.1 ntrB: nitrate ABC transporter, permease protein [Sporomusa termitida]
MSRHWVAEPVLSPMAAAGRSAVAGCLAGWLILWLPALVLGISLLLHTGLPDRQLVLTTANYCRLLAALTAIYAIWAIAGFFRPDWRRQLHGHAPLAAAAFGLLALYDLHTLKFNSLPLPFFPSPAKILEAFTHDGKILTVSTLYSLRLLFLGYMCGVLLGLPTGLLMGWYRQFRYWVNPLVRIIGPVPATAWIPVTLAVFPTSFAGSVFLIALATWFPVTVMTWSGVASVNKSYFEIARTLGADERYLMFKIALPAALPMVFIGLFMGMGTSFVTLVVAEMLGVKAGLGWYIEWAQGWGEYYKVYAALIISAVLFSSLISLLFKFRDRLLVWQRGLVKW